MPSWDRSKGGGDNGDDKPPTPQVPSYEPYVPEGTGDGADPPGDGGDQSRPGDTSQETGNGTDKQTSPNGYPALFERQDKLIEGQEQQIGRLVSDLRNRDAEIKRLKEENEQQAEIIDRLESGDQGPDAGDSPSRLTAPDKDAEKIEQLETEIAEGSAERRDLVSVITGQSKTISRLESEVESLKAKLTEADGTRDDREQSAEGQTEVETAPNSRSGHDQETQLDRGDDRPWYTKFPSKPVTDIISKSTAEAGTIVVAMGIMGGTVEKIIAGLAAIGLAVMEYRRQKNKKKGEGDD